MHPDEDSKVEGESKTRQLRRPWHTPKFYGMGVGTTRMPHHPNNTEGGVSHISLTS
jgi:hypothetical protein